MNETSLQSEGSEKSPQDCVKNRRTFLNRLWSLLGLLALIEIGWLGSSILRTRMKRKNTKEDDTFITAGETESFSRNSVTAVPEGQFYLARQQDGGFIALSRTCTHLGCSIPWDEQLEKFICPCHGSSFDIAGEVLTPPATRGLDSYPLRIENGVILVNTARPEKRIDSSKPRSVKI